MKKLILGLVLALLPQIALAEYILKGPHTTVETDGSQADGSVNLITKNAGPINFYTDNVLRSSISSTGTTSYVGGLQCGGDLAFTGSSGGQILTNTADAADTKSLIFSPAGAAGDGRGSTIAMYGAEHATNASEIRYTADVAHVFRAAAAVVGEINAAGLIMGGDTAVSGVTSAPIEIQANGSAVNAFKVIGYSATANDGPYIAFGRTKGTAAATNTIVANGDNLGGIVFSGANGTSYSNAAEMRVTSDGTPGASNDMPGAFSFYTTPDGSGTQLRRWLIQSDGDLAGDGTNSGDISLEKSGSTLRVQEGTAASACMGVGTPNGNTNVAISTTCAAAGSRIFYTRLGAITNMGVITTTVAPNGSGFSFASTGASDTGAGTVYWLIIKEAP